MKQEQLKDHVKAALRIKTNDPGINAEVEMLIGGAKADLAMSGINRAYLDSDNIDDIIVLAITTYSKAKFGFDNPESDKLYEAYRLLETHLALSTEYGDNNEE